MTYPIIFPPEPCSTDQNFKLSVGAKNRKTGASELLAFSHICKLGLADIQENVCVTIDGHRYEPDFAYIDKELGIYVDIEIDEPYTSDHHPTHYMERNGRHKDTQRNELFCKNGWYVARFTERQMFCHTASCMSMVYELVRKAGGAASVPTTVADAPELEVVSCWTREESIEMSYQNYRRSYLGFNPVNMGMSSVVRCCIMIIPVIFLSLRNHRLRKMLARQMKRYLLSPLIATHH